MDFGWVMATLQEQLTEAQDAYHRLRTGKAVRVFVDQNGERVEYAVANAAGLAAYIEELKRQISPTTSNTGPMRVWM